MLDITAIAGFAQLPPHLMREDSREAVALADQHLTQVRDRLATPEQVAEWAAAGGRWWDTPADPGDVEEIQEHTARHGVDFWRARLAVARMDGDPRAAAWDRAQAVLDLLAPLNPGEDVRDAAHAWATRVTQAEAQAEAGRVAGELADLRRRVAAALVAVERTDLDEMGHDPEDFEAWPDEVQAAGVLRRLSAGLRSIDGRRDGQTYLAWAKPEHEDVPGIGRTAQARQRLRWWSLGGVWTRRAWQVTATAVTTVDLDYGDTSVALEDVEVTVVGTGGATTFTGRALARPVGRRLWQRMAREQVRAMADLDTRLISEDELSHGEVGAAEFVAEAATNPR